MKHLILIRHGKLSIFETFSMLTLTRGDQIAEMVNLYDTCELSATSFPPHDLVTLCKNSDIYVCSCLQRTADSFLRLGITVFERSKLLNEAEIPTGILPGIVLPLGIWAFLLRLLWFAGVDKNCESYRVFRSRMREAYTLITAYFEKNESVVVMSHGFVNMLLKRIFVQNGWHCKHRQGNNGHWSYVELT
jgi:hypothetical protein